MGAIFILIMPFIPFLAAIDLAQAGVEYISGLM